MTNKQAAGVQGILDALRSGASWANRTARAAGNATKTKIQDAGNYVKDKGINAGNYIKDKAVNTYNTAKTEIPQFAQKHKNALIGAGATTGLAGVGAGTAYAFSGKTKPPAGATPPVAPAAEGLQLTPNSLGSGVADMLPLEARNYLQQTLGQDGYVRALRGLGGAGIGAGIGLGAGAIGNLMSPRKKRKSLFEDAISSALIGGGIGGAAGAIDPIYNAVSGAMGGSK